MEKCKYEGAGIWNGRCVGTKEVAPCQGYDNCKQYKPNYTKNAERIRSMTDEELAELLNQWGTSTRAWQKDKGETMYWLQQPAE